MGIKLNANVFLGTEHVGARLSTVGGYYDDASYSISRPFKVTAGETLTKSTTADAYHRICFYVNDNDIRGSEWILVSKVDDSNTVTVPAGATYARICYKTSELDGVQVFAERTPKLMAPGKNLLPIVTEDNIETVTLKSGSVRYGYSFHVDAGHYIKANSSTGDGNVNLYPFNPDTMTCGDIATYLADSAEPKAGYLCSAGDWCIVSSTGVKTRSITAINVCQLQLEAGSTATAYEPYHDPEVKKVYLGTQLVYDKDS